MLLEKSDILTLGREQALLFSSDNVTYCEVLVTCFCPRDLLLKAYYGLVRREKITPIEDLLQHEKEAAWEFAKEIAKGRLGIRELKDIVRALVAIEYFLNLK